MSDGYRLLHVGKLWDLVNSAMLEHRENHPLCSAKFNFDYNAEQQRGLCWRERVKCELCTYTSTLTNIYAEVSTRRPGAKSATANLGLNIALTQTPIGTAGMRKLFLGSNIPAPSERGMQKCATKVSKIIADENVRDMKVRRTELKLINQLRGRPENQIAIQADGLYNNALYAGVGKTPFQPATQCTYTVAENVTSKKQIIALETANKLCSKNGYHTGDDATTCDIKSAGGCTATIPMETNIGDEKKWAKACIKDLCTDCLEVKYITTDPDTGAYKAAEEVQQEMKLKTIPEHQLDTRHLAANHRKFIKNSTGVLAMMRADTKDLRQTLQNRFAVDLSIRCQAELDIIHKKSNGDFEKIQSMTTDVISAIVSCYAGEHSSCAINSYVCQGGRDINWLANSSFLSKNFNIDIENIKNKECLLKCIEYRLRKDMLEKTKLNTNSQKVESANRRIRRSLPKNVTYSRNYRGRAHSAVHNINNGPGESIAKLCRVAGCPITVGSKVAAALVTEQRISETSKLRYKSVLQKYKRKLKQKKLYRLYEKHKEEKNYLKSQLLAQNWQARRKLTKTKKSIRSDHMYAKKVSTTSRK